jgi:peptidoglycan-associated lipoprotein
MKSTVSLLFAVAALTLAGSGCAKKVASAPPPPVPVPAPAAATAPAPRAAVATRPAAAQPQPQTAVSRMPNEATRRRIDELLAKISDAYFDYDQHALRPDAIKALQADSSELRNILKDYPNYNLVVEGHCDERGSAEYNLALGDARAKAAKDYLVQVGIPAPQLSVLSYGKEKPVCQDESESCWQKNRRVHIVAAAR